MSDARAAGSSWTGEYADGRSANVRAVAVGCDGARLLIHDAGSGSLITHWELRDVRADAIQERDVVHLQCAAAPDALITLYGREVREGLSRAGVRWSGLPRSHSQRVLLMLACSIGIAAAGTLIWNAVPVVSRAIARRIPLESERSLGVRFEAQLSDAYCESDAAAVVLADLTQKLAGGGHPIPAVNVLNIAVPNAFAFPGGYLVLTRGLVESAEGPDEVAGVLAHEIAHVYERHVMTGIVRGALLSALWAASVGDFSGLMVIDPSTVFEIATLQFSREDEAEADRVAVEMLDRAQIRRDGFAAFFDRLSEGEDDLPAWLSTHPASKERADAAASRLEPGIETKPAMSDEAWSTLLAVCESAPEPPTAIHEILFD